MLKISRNTSQGILLCYGSDNKGNFHKFLYRERLEAETALFFAEENKKIRSTLIREQINLGNIPKDSLTPSVVRYIESLPVGAFKVAQL